MGVERILMTAVVINASRHDNDNDSGGEDTLLDGVIDHFSSTKWDMELELWPVGAPTQRVTGTWKIQNRLGGLRRTFKRWRPVPGLQLPVQVDPLGKRRVEIDWDLFVAHGGIEHAAKMTDAYRVQRTAEYVAEQARKRAQP